MGHSVICRLARRLALTAALLAAAFIFGTSSTSAGALLDSHPLQGVASPCVDRIPST
jgi:hypothetical protein